MRNETSWTLFDTFLMLMAIAAFGWGCFVLFVPESMFSHSSPAPRLQATQPPPDLAAIKEMVVATPAIAPQPSWTPLRLSSRWKWIVIHHSATFGGTPESIDKYHSTRMENGLAYHFIIGNGNGLPDGVVAVGRRWTEQLDGGHIDGGKIDHEAIGICLIGNFEEAAPTQMQIASLKGLIVFLQDHLSIKPGLIRGHRQMENEATLCPGRFLPIDVLVKTLRSGS